MWVAQSGGSGSEAVLISRERTALEECGWGWAILADEREQRQEDRSGVVWSLFLDYGVTRWEMGRGRKNL